MTLRPDAQAFDEIRITTIPRFKESELSGDEWRISGLIQLFRNGVVKYESQYQNVEMCAKFLSYELAKAIDEGNAYLATEGGFCDQEGCDAKATVFYQKKLNWCSSCGKSREVIVDPEYRQFCERHKERGNCGLDDSDSNYNRVERS